MTYDRRNFHKHTFCIWQERETHEVQGRKPDFRSKTGSTYYFTDEGVFRYSDHWARVANCKWRLDGKPGTGFRLGFANWEDFHPDNDTDRLYFVAVDFGRMEAQYVHRDSASPGTFRLRTASETARRIRDIRKILTTDDWADYLAGEIGILRRKIIAQLVETDMPVAQIRRTFLPKP